MTIEIIAHRRNTIEELKATPASYGAEVDIRSAGNRLILHHDPFVMGEDFESWLAHYRHGTLILNVKEDGLEDSVLALMQKFNVPSYFFLDQAFPSIVSGAKKGVISGAVRLSEYESMATVMAVSSMVDWVWVDCFTRFPLTPEMALEIREGGLKICVVSPELQGRHDPDEITDLLGYLRDTGIEIQAVCTKYPELWQFDA